MVSHWNRTGRFDSAHVAGHSVLLLSVLFAFFSCGFPAGGAINSWSLVGTVSDDAFRQAVLERAADKDQLVVAEGEVVSGLGRILKIDADSIRLKDDQGRMYRLGILGGAIEDPSWNGSAGSAIPLEAEDPIFRVSGEDFDVFVRHRAGRSVFGDTRQFKVMGGSGIDGIAMYQMDETSLFFHLGLRDGDVLRAIGNKQIKKSGDAYLAIASSREAPFAVEFEHEGVVRQVHIEVAPEAKSASTL